MMVLIVYDGADRIRWYWLYMMVLIVYGGADRIWWYWSYMMVLIVYDGIDRIWWCWSFTMVLILNVSTDSNNINRCSFDSSSDDNDIKNDNVHSASAECGASLMTT